MDYLYRCKRKTVRLYVNVMNRTFLQDNCALRFPQYIRSMCKFANF